VALSGRGVGPRPVGGTLTVSRPTVAWPRRGSVSGRGAPGAVDTWAPTGSRRGREERGAGGAWGGLEEKGMGRARRNSDVWDLFKSILN
jgi:hypothetical protein